MHGKLCAEQFGLDADFEWHIARKVIPKALVDGVVSAIHVELAIPLH